MHALRCATLPRRPRRRHAHHAHGGQGDFFEVLQPVADPLIRRCLQVC